MPARAWKRIILDYCSSRAALVQEIQPGSGVYMSGIEIDITEEVIHNKITQENNHSCLIGILDYINYYYI